MSKIGHNTTNTIIIKLNSFLLYPHVCSCWVPFPLIVMEPHMRIPVENKLHTCTGHVVVVKRRWERAVKIWQILGEKNHVSFLPSQNLLVILKWKNLQKTETDKLVKFHPTKQILIQIADIFQQANPVSFPQRPVYLVLSHHMSTLSQHGLGKQQFKILGDINHSQAGQCKSRPWWLTWYNRFLNLKTLTVPHRIHTHKITLLWSIEFNLLFSSLHNFHYLLSSLFFICPYISTLWPPTRSKPLIIIILHMHTQIDSCPQS